MKHGLLILFLAAHAVSANGLKELEELCSFHLDFEGTVQAAFADGQLIPNSVRVEEAGKPIEAKLDGYFVPGLVGKALSTRNEQTSIWIDYPADKNFNTRQGTILFWMKYETIVTNAASLLAINSPGFMYLTMPQEKEKQQALVCFLPVEDIAHPQNNAYPGPIDRAEPWKAGEWHQVCLTWSLKEMCYYEDGKLLAKQALRKPAPENTAKAFGVILAGWSGSQHNTVVMDELYIFPSALTPELIRSTLQK